MLAGTGEIAGAFTAARLITPTSRAIPAMLKQSARFGVKLISIATSFKFKYSRKSVPIGASAGSSIIPL